jgi:hypothetical protein
MFISLKTYVIPEDYIMRNGLLNIIVTIVLSTLILSTISLNCLSKPVGWSDDIRLTKAPSYGGYPSLALNGDNIYLVWQDARGEKAYDDYEIYFKKSSDNGKTWTIDKRLSNALHYSSLPELSTDGSVIHVVWMDDREAGWDIYYNQSEDYGETWLGEKRISPDPFTSECGEPDIDADVGYVHIIYPDSSDVPGSEFQLYYINSSDNGKTWSLRQRLTSLIRDSDRPAIAANGSNIHIVWMDHYDKNGQPTFGGIFYINSSDNGLTWNEEINLTDLNIDSDYPDIAINGNNLHIVYKAKLNGLWGVYYRRSEDGGITWTEQVKLSNSTSDIYSPVIALNGSYINVVWTDERDSNREIYYKYSLDNGENWSDDIRLTYDSAQSITQDIAFNDKVHVVWGDDRDGNFEIYYKYYPFYYPPTNLTVDIWETNLTLKWTTPQTSLSPVDYYLIYRVTDPEAFTFSDSEIIYNSSGTGNDLLTTWNDTTALLDENNNYYYVVRAVYENGESDTNENIVGKFVMPLNSGWNLFSLPLAQNDTNIPEVLKSINGNYDVIWIYDAKEGRWRSSTIDLTDINRTMGLWIHMKSACNLSVVGAIPESTDIALYEGWNLVGYPSLKSRNFNGALSGITWQAVQHYDAFNANDPWKHNSTKKPDNLNDLKEMQPGRGYWVYVTINDTWVRTRTIENNKMVIWRVSESKEKIINNQPIYDPTIKYPIEMEEEDDYQMDNVDDEKPIIRDQENNLAISLIPLIILISFIFAEIGYFHKNKK